MAIADYGEAIRLEPGNARLYYNRSIVYGLKGDTTRSQADRARVGRLPAGWPKSPRVVAAISAPIVYNGLMLILSDPEGVGAIVFTTDVDKGVKYYAVAPFWVRCGEESWFLCV